MRNTVNRGGPVTVTVTEPIPCYRRSQGLFYVCLASGNQGMSFYRLREGASVTVLKNKLCQFLGLERYLTSLTKRVKAQEWSNEVCASEEKRGQGKGQWLGSQITVRPTNESPIFRPSYFAESWFVFRLNHSTLRNSPQSRFVRGLGATCFLTLFD